MEKVVHRCEHHPIYTQQFLYHLWDAPRLDAASVDHIEQQILQRHRLAFINLWESLTQNQKKTLKLIAHTNGRGIFSAASLQLVGLNRTSQVTRAIEALLENEIIEKNERYHIQDVLLKKWLLAI